jgi:hypothetical protein
MVEKFLKEESKGEKKLKGFGDKRFLFVNKKNKFVRKREERKSGLDVKDKPEKTGCHT